MNWAQSQAIKASTSLVVKDTTKLLAGGVLGFVLYALNLIPVFGSALSVTIGWGVKEFQDWVHTVAVSVFGFIPNFVTPALVPAVMSSVTSDRDNLIRAITMDCVSYWGWDTGLFDYEPQSRGNRIAGALESKCKSAGVPVYEILMLKARIFERFGNKPLKAAAENSANANKGGYSGWLVNPGWIPESGGGGFVPVIPTGTTPSNNTLIFAGAGLLILLLALRK